MASNLQGLTDRLQSGPSEISFSERVVERLDEVVDLQKDIKKLLSASGSGKGKETQLQKIKDTTNPLSISKVDGESANKILSAATENLSKDLEKFSEDEHKMMIELVKEIGKLTEKNLEGFNKGIKEVIDLAKKGQALAEKTGNAEGAKRFAGVAAAAKDEHFKQNNMGLRGDKDTFVNRLGRSMGIKNADGTPKEFNSKKASIGQNIKAFGTAVKEGGKVATKSFASGLLLGNEGSLRRQLFVSDKNKRVKEREKQGWAPEAEQMKDLTKSQKKLLADKGIAPASEKDISYRKDGKPVSLKDINNELEKDFNEKRAGASPITQEQPDENKSNEGLASIAPSSSGDSASSLQEESTGMSQDPVVAALEEQTKKLDEISDTLSQANELFEAIKTAVDKIAGSSDSEEGGGEGGIGDSLLDTAGDLLSSRRGRRGSAGTSRSERARAQPRDARGRFVKRGSPDAVAPRGRMGGRGRGLVGLGLGLAGAVGIGAAMSDDDSSSADVAANTAMTAADLAPSPTSSPSPADATKTEAKATEKAGAKGVEKAGAKGAEKAAAKGVGKVGAKGAAKVGAKALGKSLLKKIPGVGLLAGGVFAAQRALSGDWAGAGLELASGAASTIPGVGTAASVGLDAALAARDMGAFDSGDPAAPAGATSQSPATGQAAPAAQASPTSSAKPGAVQGKPGGGIFSKVGGFIKKNPLMAAAGLGGVGLAAVGASKAWDWMTGGDEPKVESGQNPDSGILEQDSEKARDKMNVNVPPPTVINQGGGGNTTPEKTTVPNTKSYVRDDESSWMRFALKRAMA